MTNEADTTNDDPQKVMYVWTESIGSTSRRYRSLRYGESGSSPVPGSTMNLNMFEQMKKQAAIEKYDIIEGPPPTL